MNQQKLTFRTFFFFKTLPLQSASATTLRDLSLPLSIETPALNTPYATTQSHFHKAMHFESGEKPSACQHLFTDTSCDSPLTEGNILILRTDGPGLSPNEPMAIVQADVQVESPLPVEVTSSEGRYLIKIQAANIYWEVWKDHTTMVYYWSTTMERAKRTPPFR